MLGQRAAIISSAGIHKRLTASALVRGMKGLRRHRSRSVPRAGRSAPGVRARDRAAHHWSALICRCQDSGHRQRFPRGRRNRPTGGDLARRIKQRRSFYLVKTLVSSSLVVASKVTRQQDQVVRPPEERGAAWINRRDAPSALGSPTRTLPRPDRDPKSRNTRAAGRFRA